MVLVVTVTGLVALVVVVVAAQEVLLLGTTTAAKRGNPPKFPILPQATIRAPSADLQRARSVEVGSLPQPASTEVERGKKRVTQRRTANLRTNEFQKEQK